MEENKKTTPAATEVVSEEQTKDYRIESIGLLLEQMKLLSERSTKCQDSEIAEISKAMVKLHEVIWRY